MNLRKRISTRSLTMSADDNSNEAIDLTGIPTESAEERESEDGEDKSVSLLAALNLLTHEQRLDVVGKDCRSGECQ
jgi:hypothetical protein